MKKYTKNGDKNYNRKIKRRKNGSKSNRGKDGRLVRDGDDNDDDDNGDDNNDGGGGDENDDDENDDDDDDDDDTQREVSGQLDVERSIFVNSVPRSPSSSWMASLASKTTVLIAGTCALIVVICEYL